MLQLKSRTKEAKWREKEHNVATVENTGTTGARVSGFVIFTAHQNTLVLSTSAKEDAHIVIKPDTIEERAQSWLRIEKN